MRHFDNSIYVATRDRPEGPLYLEEDTGSVGTIQPSRDENGNVTKGGAIGVFLGYGIIVAGLFYCMYLL